MSKAAQKQNCRSNQATRRFECVSSGGCGATADNVPLKVASLLVADKPSLPQFHDHGDTSG